MRDARKLVVHYDMRSLIMTFGLDAQAVDTVVRSVHQALLNLRHVPCLEKSGVELVANFNAPLADNTLVVVGIRAWRLAATARALHGRADNPKHVGGNELHRSSPACGRKQSSHREIVAHRTRKH